MSQNSPEDYEPVTMERRITPWLKINKLGKVYFIFNVIIYDQYGDSFHNSIGWNENNNGNLRNDK